MPASADAARFLAKAGAQLPVGTTFPNRAFLGVQGEMTPRTFKGKSVMAYSAKDFGDHSPVQNAGGTLGDEIVSINDKTFKDDAAFFKLLDKVQIGSTYTVVVLRGGVPQTLSVLAETRPPIKALTLPSQARVAASMTPAAAPEAPATAPTP
ncbi:PDZ domain-containing protein [Caulobacter sp. DWP3-1-3b2]|uniref:PDZ domain-containing protein n=1 Tax=Caulobacter sp. DWP3-1-3b2 TaxID=2804643 RepID=UPI003CEDB5F4